LQQGVSVDREGIMRIRDVRLVGLAVSDACIVVKLPEGLFFAVRIGQRSGTALVKHPLIKAGDSRLALKVDARCSMRRQRGRNRFRSTPK
jgi:hypothetical protein